MAQSEWVQIILWTLKLKTSVDSNNVLNLIGEEGLEVYNTLKLTEEQKKEYNVVVNELEKYMVPKKKKVYERFLFYNRKQEEGEPKAHLKEVQGQDAKIDVVLGRGRKPEKGNKPHGNSKASEGGYVCGRCGSKHQPRSCPAYGRKCNHCQNYGHFKKFCRNKLVREVLESQSHPSEDEEDFMVSTVVVNEIKNSNVWVESPHYPRSNGLAEKAVQIAKNMLKKCDDIHLALLEYRNTPISGSDESPAQLLNNRHLRSKLPIMENASDKRS
ncbi:hypothetical protein JTB14_020061 [Gonioctena quinquepunctata]|nr:hypothetical protein JTB14_020061 [Gonioctena quinquepunctata]